MRLYGLIGYPLGHSFSKQYFTEKFARESIAGCMYETFPIENIDQFAALIKNTPELKGLNVTIPYKEQVLPFVHYLSPEVKAIGAANCIKINGNELTAYNTDIIGFEQSFSKLLQPHHKKALVLGTGGSSKAIQYVLKKMGIEFLVVSRTNNAQPGFVRYEMIDQTMMREYCIIINCTPAGMSPNDHTLPNIPYQLITPQHYLFDLVYKPAATLFLQKGQEKGAAVQNGYEMLILQAEAGWKIWNSPQ